MFLIKWLIKLIIITMIGWVVRWYIIQHTGLGGMLPF